MVPGSRPAEFSEPRHRVDDLRRRTNTDPAKATTAETVPMITIIDSDEGVGILPFALLLTPSSNAGALTGITIRQQCPDQAANVMAQVQRAGA